MKKSSASNFLKHMISMLCSMAKAKSAAIKSKTNAVKARLIVVSLLKNKKFSLGSISHKIHAAIVGVGGGHQQDEAANINVLYNALANEPHSSSGELVVDDGDDDKYPDLRHSLFDDEDYLGDPNGSVIDFVRNSKELEGEDFSLEDEIDHVADLFITKFHKRIRMQKLESFKRYQDMLDRSA
uniref:Uncharacterized protein n=1 Tax=Davidia involucrata TaxID=16924 RepID=A0A5B7BL69_DAVIN